MYTNFDYAACLDVMCDVIGTTVRITAICGVCVKSQSLQSYFYCRMWLVEVWTTQVLNRLHIPDKGPTNPIHLVLMGNT